MSAPSPKGRYHPLENLSLSTTIQVVLLAPRPADTRLLRGQGAEFLQQCQQEDLQRSHQLQAGPKHVLLVLSKGPSSLRILQSQQSSPKRKKAMLIKKQIPKTEIYLTFVLAAVAARMRMRRWMLD